MGKILFYVASSLDGYLADENGGVDWLLPFQNVPYDYGYGAFMKRLGVVVTGSKTFEQARNFPGGWSYGGIQTYVCTRRQPDIEGLKGVALWPGDIRELGEKVRQEKKDTWLLGGAALAASFFNEGLVDEMILSVMPLVLGKGLPLFTNIETPLPLKLENMTSFPNGVIQMTYTFP